jgi:hypothetical protein
MFAHFGHKWLSLFRGPAWQYETQTAPIIYTLTILLSQKFTVNCTHQKIIYYKYKKKYRDFRKIILKSSS